MESSATGSNYYKRSWTEYEVERYELDLEYAIYEAKTAKTKHADALAAKDAEIAALEKEIAAAKIKRN
jgi:hypothetical protein